MVGVARDLSPNTGSGAELYTVIGHAPRHLDRNIALVGRVIAGMEHLSSLPRGPAPLGVYEDPAQRVPILAVRLASDLPEEIGRASWRERVCQYVSISVGAGSLKKKTNTAHNSHQPTTHKCQKQQT